jgi:hypothetical protein
MGGWQEKEKVKLGPVKTRPREKSSVKNFCWKKAPHDIGDKKVARHQVIETSGARQKMSGQGEF